MSTEKKFKTALDETRLLMLGAQIFFGFQFNGAFQTATDSLPFLARYLDAGALLLMTGTIGCLITPAARHRLAHRGHLAPGLFRATSRFAGIALFPFSLSLAIDIYIVMARSFGQRAGLLLGAFFWAAALMFWYVLEFLFRDRMLRNKEVTQETRREVGLTERIDHMLTEARVVLPGAQALLGFQLLAMLTDAFDRLPRESQLLHAAALGCIALTVVLLIAPAAFHRLAFAGADSEQFYRIGSLLVSVALLPLTFGMAGDIYVAAAKLTGNAAVSVTSALVALFVLLALWYGYPLYLRRSVR
jgi:hypothetical protein